MRGGIWYVVVGTGGKVEIASVATLPRNQAVS